MIMGNKQAQAGKRSDCREIEGGFALVSDWLNDAIPEPMESRRNLKNAIEMQACSHSLVYILYFSLEAMLYSKK